MNYFMKPPDSMDFREDHGNSDLWIPRIVAFNAETGALRCRFRPGMKGRSTAVVNQGSYGRNMTCDIGKSMTHEVVRWF